MIMSIDIETKSSVDLAKCGVYAYAQDKDFEILLLAYAFDDEEVSVIDLAKNKLIPSRIKEAILNPNIIKYAFNANFERVCLSKYFNTKLTPESFRCSQAMALRLGLSHGLQNVSEILDLDVKKDKEGRALIK
jgi:DNA polymerase